MKKSIIDLVAARVEGEPPIIMLYAQGNLDCFTYLDLIDTTRTLYDRGERNLILNMSQIPVVSRLCGLFALRSIAMIFSGRQPLNPETGWQAIHNLAVWDNSLQQHFKLLRPRLNVEASLKQSGLPIYDSLWAVIASFSHQKFSRN